MREAPDSLTPNPIAPASKLGRLLIVDDEVELMKALVEMLIEAGYEAEGFTSGKAALTALNEREFDMLLTDLMMPGMDGITLLRAGLDIDPNLVGVLMTGQGTVQTAVEAMKSGAFDYVLKPFKLQAILPMLARAMELRRLRLENVQLREAVVLYDVSQTIAFTLDTQAVVEKTVEAALQQSAGDEATVLLLTPTRDELYVAAVRGAKREGLLGERVPIGEGIAGWLARHGEALILNGAVSDPRFTPLYPRADISSALAIPMLSAGKVVGVLTINALHRRRPYTQGQVKALSILANTAAAALENVTLYSALGASESKYRELVEQASDGIASTDPQGNYVEVNSKMCEMLGYAREELLHMNIRDVITPEDLAQTPVRLDEMRAGKHVISERRLRRKDGAVLPVEISAKMLPNGNFQGITRDITGRKQAEAKLQAYAHEQAAVATLGQRALSGADLSELMDEAVILIAEILHVDYSKVLELLPDGSALRLRAGVGWKEGFVGQATVGAGRDSQAGYTLLSNAPVVVEDLRTETRFNGPTLLRDHAVISGMSVIIAGKDRPFGVLGAHTVTKRAFTQDDVIFLQAVANTLATAIERNQADDALRASESKYRALVEQASDGIASTDAQGGYVEVNSKLCEMLGYTREELLRLNLRDIIVSEGLAQAPLYVDDLRVGKTVLAEDVWRRKDGALLPVEVSTKMLSDGNFQGIVRDITERKHRERALRESEARFSTLFRASPVAITLMTITEGRFIDVNEAFEQLADYLREEMVGRTAFELDLWVDSDRVHMINALVEQGALHNLELRLRRKSGVVIDALSSFEFIELGGERFVLGLHLDITERKQREREREAIIAVTTTLRTAVTRSEIVSVILDQVMTFLRAEAAIVVIQDPLNGELVIELGLGGWRPLTSRRYPPGTGMTQHVIDSGQPYVSNDAPNDSSLYRPPNGVDFQAVACVPLIAQRQSIGVVWIARAVPVMPDEVRILTAVADIAANALQRATLHDETRRRLQHLQALRAIDEAIIGSFDVRLTLRVLLDQAMAHLRVDATDVLLLDPHMQTLNYAFGSGFRSLAVQRTRLRLGEGYARRIALERKLVRIPNLPEAAQEFGRAELLADEGFTAYYGMPLIVKGQVKGILEVFHRAPLNPDKDWLDFLESLAGQAAIAIDNAQLFNDLQRSNASLALAYDTTLEGWSRALDLRDKETEGHTQRVTEMTLRLAQAMGMSEDELLHVRRGALLHDIGKMGIPDAILLKPGPLTDDEWVIMRRHPTYAFELLSPIPYLRPALDIPYCHHEKWDGSGYPRALKGAEIPLAARVFAVVDVWDALRSDRPYRAAWPEAKVREHVRSLIGSHFDPQVGDAFLNLEL